jgi:hypothetical protein
MLRSGTMGQSLVAIAVAGTLGGAIAGLGIVSSTPTVAWAQEQVVNHGPLHFRPGATSLSLSAFLPANQIDRYTFDAQAGQQASVVITSPNNEILLTLVTPQGVPLTRYQSGSFRWAGQLPEAGTYRLDVVAPDQGGHYTLNLDIQPDQAGGGGAQLHNRGDIHFAPGAIGTSVSRSISTHDIDRYTLEAQAGQQMSISLMSRDNNVGLTIVDPNGFPLVRYQSGATSWNGRLTAVGTYTIDATSLGSTTDYTMHITIR